MSSWHVPAHWTALELREFVTEPVFVVLSGLFEGARAGCLAGRILDRQAVMVYQREDCAGTWIVPLFRVSYQRVPGPAMTQPASTGLTQKLNATSIICAR